MYPRLRSDGISLPTLNGERRCTFSTIRLATAESETADPAAPRDFLSRVAASVFQLGTASQLPGITKEKA
jgi:hypothetical protein